MSSSSSFRFQIWNVGARREQDEGGSARRGWWPVGAAETHAYSWCHQVRASLALFFSHTHTHTFITFITYTHSFIRLLTTETANYPVSVLKQNPCLFTGKWPSCCVPFVKVRGWTQTRYGVSCLGCGLKRTM